MKDHASARGRDGFTLVELLVLIAIIVMLVALLLPSLRQARNRAKDAVCGSNLHQVSVGVFAYTSDAGDVLPYNDVHGDFLHVPQKTIGGQWNRGWPTHYTGLGKLFGMQYVASGRVLWCGNEDLPREKAGSRSGLGYRDLESSPADPGEIRTDYWYRGGLRMKFTDHPPPAERVQDILAPNDGMVMCGGWASASQEEYINWYELHQARGFNLLLTNGAVVWYDYGLKPQPGIEEWGPDNDPTRFRPDYPKLTLQQASRYYHGVDEGF